MNGWRKAVGFLVVAVLVSCQDKPKETPPSGLIPKDSMVRFLREIHRLESGLLMSGIRQDSADALFRIREKRIFKQFGLDTGRVNRSLRYYTRNLDLLDSMYKEMIRNPDTSLPKGNEFR